MFKQLRLFRYITFISSVVLALLTTSCGTTLTVSSNSPAKTATAASSSTTTCAQVLTGAGAASGGTSFSDMLFPPNSFSTLPTKTKGGSDGQFTILEADACTSATTVDGIQQFFTSNYPAKSWHPSDYFPFDGYFEDTCGGPHCWVTDTNGPRYLDLEQPTDKGNGVVVYHLRFATPPPTPSCPGYPAGYYYKITNNYTSTTVYNNIPLPPLTQLQGDAAMGGKRGEDLCSAASTATILSFLNTHLTAMGWHVSSSSGGITIYQNGSYLLNVVSGSPVVIWWQDPDFHP
jgi:hypothetical protein